MMLCIKLIILSKHMLNSFINQKRKYRGRTLKRITHLFIVQFTNSFNIFFTKCTHNEVNITYCVTL